MKSNSSTVPSARLARTRRGWPQTALLAATLVCLEGLPAMASEGHASAESRHTYAIAPGSLAGALNRLAETAGVQLIYDGTLTQGMKTQGLSGSYTPREALQKLLGGTGLSARPSGRETYTIEQAPRGVPSSHSGETPLDKVTVIGAAIHGTDDPHNEDYAVSNATTATKTDTPVMETPVSVQVVPRAVMDDRKANSLREAVETVSGVGFMPVDGGVFNVFVLRGFVNDSTVFRNGLRLDGFNFDTANVERVEVLKGPAAMLYGRGQPGGLINLTTKRPLEEAYYSMEQQFGSFDFYRTMVDVTGPINDDRTLLYRFNLAYQNNDSFRNHVFLERVLTAPTITWRPSDRTEISFGLEFQDDNFQRDDGIPAVGERPADIPIRRFLNDPNDPLDHQNQLVLNLNWQHHITDSWTIRNRFMAVPFKNYMDRAIKPIFLLDDNRTIFRNGVGQTEDQEVYATNLELTGDFDTAWLHHDVLLGYDYYRKDNVYRFHAFDPSPFAPVDIFDPVFPPLPVELVPFDEWGNFRQVSVIRERWHAIYFQDQMRLLENIYLLGGGRHDWAEVGRGDDFANDSVNRAAANFQNNRNERFSPRVGLLYRPVSWFSVYGNYTESFGTNNGRAASGEPFEPETATQYEAGVKTELWEGRLFASLAFYHLTKNNILTSDVSTPDLTDQVAIGKARSRGIEFDMTGKLDENISLTAAYAWTDTEITEDGYGNEGNRLPLAPLHSGSVWGKYDFDYAAPEGS
jgi:iron complex outermembrane receptor protein